MLHENEIPLGRAKDLRGQKFGRLTPLYRVYSPIKRAVWHCICDCGNEKDVPAADMVYGKIRSCGCLSTENRSQNGKKNKKDLIGQVFGELTVLRDSGERTPYRAVIWECKCSCGRIHKVSTTNLKSGTRSCGKCRRVSYGEDKIRQILTENKIPFIEQKTFSTCRFPNTNGIAKFDFYINNSYLVEYDGEQHFKYRAKGWDNEENYKAVLQRDQFKNQWCRDNNIPLIRIPYTHFKDLNLNDLLLETSEWRIV